MKACIRLQYPVASAAAIAMLPAAGSAAGEMDAGVVNARVLWGAIYSAYLQWFSTVPSAGACSTTASTSSAWQHLMARRALIPAFSRM